MKEDFLKERFEWNLKDQKFCLTGTKGWFSTHASNHHIVFLPMNFEDYLLYFICQYFLGFHSHIFCRRVSRFILGLKLFDKKVCTVSKALITWVGTGAIWAWKTIFEIATLLRTTIHLSRVRFWYCQGFNTLCPLEKNLTKLHSSFILLLYEK